MREPAAIPAHIWQTDATTWSAFARSRDVNSTYVLRQYKRDITHFYIALNKPINAVNEQDIREYTQLLTIRGLKPATVTRVTNCIRRYWQFAHTQEVHV